uniref:Uncharacterized protein n=1 Tax=Meloidogyne enterolobii TaxID=390850 RepID=A0A6V7WJ27_MELEN|nr:unnamed protein product [Meloidogyne enterolobii]
MIFFKILLIINTISITQSKTSAEEKADLETLLFVTAVWRHGDRTPTSLLPSDKQNTVEMIKEKFGGLGQLTELGALQQFELGILLRDRYSGFLPDEYSKNEIGYRSSYYNRTKMSILANQQGMFASNGQNAPKLPLTENVSKTGIVIKYLQKGEDPYVFDEVDCPVGLYFMTPPVAKNADEQIFESEEFREIEQANRPFLQYIANNSGLFNLTLRNIIKLMIL